MHVNNEDIIKFLDKRVHDIEDVIPRLKLFHDKSSGSDKEYWAQRLQSATEKIFILNEVNNFIVLGK